MRMLFSTKNACALHHKTAENLRIWDLENIRQCDKSRMGECIVWDFAILTKFYPNVREDFKIIIIIKY